MDIGLQVEDYRARILDQAPNNRWGLTSLHGFFQFSHWERSFSDPRPLQDCFFYDLYLDPPPMPPDGFRDAGLFEICFPTILEQLAGTSSIVTLFVTSVDLSLFEEFTMIRDVLAPRNLRYVLLPDPILPGSRRTEIDVGHLVFEWPASEAGRIADWFMCPQVEIEGYVSPTLPLGRIAELYFTTDTEARVRELLRSIEFGFRLGVDFNHLLVLTDKLDMKAMHHRLQLPRLNQALSRAITAEGND